MGAETDTNLPLPVDSPNWARLRSFQFDADGAAYGFSKRLAEENEWAQEFACRVIEEYRRFLYLGCVANRSVTPSDEVDQAWHLHLVYTDSYWNVLCAEVLQKPFHHGPTRGGQKERIKYHDQYEATLDMYRHCFGEPPSDIWPPVSRRFAAKRFRRVDLMILFVARWRTVFLGGAAVFLAGIVLGAFLFAYIQ